MIKDFDDLDSEVKDYLTARKRLRDRKYLDFLQGSSCLVCGELRKESVVGHHLIAGCNRGQSKVADCFVVPLCWVCHLEVHKNEKVFWERHFPNVDIREVSFYFWKEIRKNVM